MAPNPLDVSKGFALPNPLEVSRGLVAPNPLDGSNAGLVSLGSGGGGSFPPATLKLPFSSSFLAAGLAGLAVTGGLSYIDAWPAGAGVTGFCWGAGGLGSAAFLSSGFVWDAGGVLLSWGFTTGVWALGSTLAGGAYTFGSVLVESLAAVNEGTDAGGTWLVWGALALVAGG